MGFLTDVNASLLNVGLQRTQGYDVDVVYEHEFSSFDFTADLSMTYTDEQTQEVFDVLSDFEGKWGYPQWVAQLDLRADWRDWTFFYNIDWIDETTEEPVNNRICKTDAKTYQSLATRYRGSDWEIIGTIRNLANEDPAIVSDGCGSQSAGRVYNTIPGAGYDLIGRSYVLQVSKSFDF